MSLTKLHPLRRQFIIQEDYDQKSFATVILLWNGKANVLHRKCMKAECNNLACAASNSTKYNNLYLILLFHYNTFKYLTGMKCSVLLDEYNMNTASIHRLLLTIRYLHIVLYTSQ